MKFTRVDIEENVNISDENPLKEFFVLGFKVLLVFASLYIFIGFALEVVLVNLSVEHEENIANFIWDFKEEKSLAESEKKVQKLIDKLSRNIPMNKRHFTVHLISDDNINAAALPGGHILVYSGLLKAIRSENELAFILAHEMGHIVHKDSIKSLSKGMALSAISMFLFGNDKSLNTLFNGSIESLQLKFSRDAENNADKFGLHLLNHTYGHSGGATNFFEKLAKDNKMPTFMYYLLTHPSPQSRINNINDEIKFNNFDLKTVKKIIFE